MLYESRIEDYDMLFIKYTLRSLQEHAERRLLGGVLQALLWRYRHVYKRGWAESYLNTLDHRVAKPV